MLSALPLTTEKRRTLLILIGILLIGALLRGWAVLRLPVDFDEPIYLQAGFDYAAALRSGDWNAVIDYPENREHPAFGKLLYGLAVLALGRDTRGWDTTWALGLYASRSVSAVFGTLAALLLALVNPLAGGLLAVHTLVVKYTAQAYLEALPHLASVAAVLAFVRSASARDRWFWFSALALGVTAAGKFTYLPVAVVILYLAVFEKRLRWRDLLFYAAVAVATFWLLNPTLWHNSISRLADALFFHTRYSRGAHVQASGYPWYQPLYWISRSPPLAWHPDVFFFVGLDGLIFVLALGGLYWEWHERRWVVVWILTSLLFLLIWPTKWPQYTLVLVPALCLAAASAVTHLYRWLKERELYWDLLRGMFVAPPRSFWIAAGVLLLAFAVVYTALTVEMVFGQLGWSHFTTKSTFLPSNTVYDILADRDEQMILGTERGAVIWSPPATTDMPDSWIVFTTENSGLPHNRVLALARDRADRIWFGTEDGLASYDGTEWHTYLGEDIGLVEDQVYALAVGSDDRLWVGTSAGVAVLDDQGWTIFTSATSGLANDRVRSLAVQARPAGDWVWFGTENGVSRLDTATDEWVDLTGEFQGGSAVIALTVDSAGRLWAGTLGGGLGLWDGGGWEFYRTGNSEIPFNTVNEISEVEPGILWVGTSRPAEVGGGLAEFDGEKWKTFSSRNSGYSGAEPLAIALDNSGRRWIGTRTSGVDIFQVRR